MEPVHNAAESWSLEYDFEDGTWDALANRKPLNPKNQKPQKP